MRKNSALKLFFCLILSILVNISVQEVFADISQDEARTDCNKLTELYEKYRNSFEGVYGSSLFYGTTAEEAEAAYKNIEDIEKNILPEIEPVLATFAEKYGTNSMDVSNKLLEIGLKDIYSKIGSRFDELYRNLSNVEKSRKATAEYIANSTKTTLSNVDFFTPDIRVKKMTEAKDLLVAAQKFDPNNSYINEVLSDIDVKIAEAADKIEKDIDEKTWAGNIDNFSGPGDIKRLAEISLDFFKKSKQWGANPDKKVDILAVCIRGPWQVADKNIFGQVISWRLPIHLAITDENMKEKNVARVYELSIVTQEGVPNKVEKAPPFDGYWVGNNWMMRLNKVPK